MLRIGISQRVEDLRERGERRDCLDQAWTPLLEKIGMVAVPIPNRLEDVAAFVDVLGLTGVILSGGNDIEGLADAANTAPERDACEHALLDLSARTGLPVLGVCRGLQIMTMHHGGKLSRVDGHVATRHQIETHDVGVLELEDREVVNSFHDWGVLADDVGKELCVAATAPDGTVEAIHHPGYRQAAIMWHPERPVSDARDAALLQAFFEGD